MISRFTQADTIVPGAGNPQSLNRYSYVYNNPLKYTDSSGHCPWCPFAAVLGAAYVGGRVAWEVGTLIFPGADRRSRDQIGGSLVVDISETIASQSSQQSVDPTLVGAILRYESAAVERRFFTLLPGSQPGFVAEIAEAFQVLLQGDTASIGPGQMQLRRARELEELGYVSPRKDDLARVQALLGKETSAEYVAGMIHYLSDQLKTLPGFAELGAEEQQRLILIGYNAGWDGDQGLRRNIEKHGFQFVLDNFPYQNILDEYLRWLSGQ
jgi:hypothetical protein